MRYTVFESGRPIGETDLSFARMQPCARFGWFYPNALGETLMPVACALLPAMMALHALEEATGSTPDSPSPAVQRSSELADWSEAVHHLAQLDLVLRRADGTVIPTEQISLQDTEAMRALAMMEDGDDAGMSWEDEIDAGIFEDVPDEDATLVAELEAELEAETAAELEAEVAGMEVETISGSAAIAQWLREHGVETTSDDREEPEMGRYQIFVMLRDDADVP